MSNPGKRQIPDVPSLPAQTGNLLSSVAPPAELPNFITAAPTPVVMLQNDPQPQIPIPAAAVPQQRPVVLNSEEHNFSPVIPLNKGEPLMPLRSPDEAQSPVSIPESAPDIDKLGDIMPGSGLLTWVKGAVASGGLLQRVAEKAKSSVDSMITTLDPQMKEYLNTGGDIYLVVASDKETKIAPIREAFQAVFGKATVVGVPAQASATAPQPVGAAAAYAAAKQRLAHVRSSADVTNNTPVVAVEGYLAEVLPDRWHEASLLVLSQPSLGIELLQVSQATGVPAAAVAAMRAATPQGCPHEDTGFSVTVGQVMADNLQVPHTQWQEAATGVSRRETLLLAARALAGAYQRLLAVSANES